MTRANKMGRFALGALVLLMNATALQAQQANPSVVAFGMGNNYTAAARGYETIGWNPAMLAIGAQPKFSVGALIGGANGGLAPVDVQDIADYSGVTIPRSVRQGWVNDLRNSSKSETGALDGGVTFLALSWGHMAAQVSASAGANMNLNADALETMLLGNADAVASNRTLRPSGGLTASAFITSAVSWSKALNWKPMGAKDESFALGVTGKWVLGAANVRVQDAGSTITKDAITARFPAVFSSGTDAGSGIGMDVGAAWHGGNTTVGLTVMNLFNSFAWDGAGFECIPMTIDIDVNRTNTSTEKAACSGSTQVQVDAATAMKFMPSIRAGAAWTGLTKWTLTADVQSQLGDEAETIVLGPKTSVGVGAEYRGLAMLPLRGGFSVIEGGTQMAGGAGLRFGRYEFNVGMQLRNVDGMSSTNVMLGLLSVR
ncbi:MAG: conjugal transfer protein TraF [Gemmatimonadota bacterium]|nr:conjugal transfer protein TraF [Gemmatimonadota bacterium]